MKDYVGFTFKRADTVQKADERALKKAKDFLRAEAGAEPFSKLVIESQLKKVPVGGSQVTWLPYLGKFVTVCSALKRPVLTGFMTGCPLVYLMYRGAPFLAHVGTVDTGTPDHAFINSSVKTALTSAAHGAMVRLVRAWNPHSEHDTATKWASLGTKPYVMGGVDLNGSCFTLIATMENNVYTIREVYDAVTVEGDDCLSNLLASRARSSSVSSSSS